MGASTFTIILFLLLGISLQLDSKQIGHKSDSQGTRLPLGSRMHPKRHELKMHSVEAVQRHNDRDTRNLTSMSNSKFPDSGPFAFDYLLGEDSFIRNDAEVIFIDYGVPQSLITQYKNAGKMVICYVNVGAWEEWRSDADDFPEEVLGNDYEGWEGERWLDIRRLDILLPIMRRRYDTAKSKGCQGIDPDNMNGFSIDTGFSLSYANQLNYNRAVSQLAHAVGMFAGLKNTMEQAQDMFDDVDFAVLEQCAAYDECDIWNLYVDNGKPVFAIEYTDAWEEWEFWEEVCPLVERDGMSFILKDYDLHGDFIVSCL